MITVGAIDDDRMLLEMLKSWMAAVPDIQLIHTAATVDEYIQLGVANHIVLLDLNLKDNSSPAENVVRLTSLGSKVLIVSIIADQEYVIATLEAGAEGYLTKDHGPEALVTSIRQIAAGELTPSQELAFAVTRDNRPARPQLSPQERRLLGYYGHGMTLGASARKIGVSPRTAEDYLNRIKKKYEEAGRPARTKLELAQRLREDRLEDEPRLLWSVRRLAEPARQIDALHQYALTIHTHIGMLLSSACAREPVRG